MKALAGQKVRLVNVATKFLLQTNGVDGTDVVVDLPPNIALEWGPQLVSVTAHTQTELKSTLFRWKVVGYWSIDGGTWSAPFDIFSWQSVQEAKIQPPFNDATKLGLRMRYALVCSPVTGQAREQAVVSCTLAFEFKT